LNFELKNNMSLTKVILGNEHFYKISDSDAMRPFFMNVVSDSDHWMFISSNGGLTAGRKNPEYALFPYYTDDKITEFADITGSKSVFQIHSGGDIQVWEPFSERFTGRYQISRNLYKSVYGNQVVFEEINHELQLTFRYRWSSSDVYGFVKTSELINTSDADCQITLLDGIQNIMPYGVPSSLQSTTSNLVDAYKRSELEPDSGIGIFALSAIIVDKAEPSEALKANIAWSLGLEQPKYLLSSLQLDRFRRKQQVQEERDVKGEKGAYFVCAEVSLPGKGQKSWKIVADVRQNHSQVAALRRAIMGNDAMDKKIEADIQSGTEKLIQLVAGADGLQCTADALNDTRHFSNVLFNIMRGGTFDRHYRIEKADFVAYLAHANKEAAANNRSILEQLPPAFSQHDLKNLLLQSDDADLIRLGMEYLPLKFSRRHGDPSRPWNYFSINTESETDGSKILDYEGNWRDLFQNWEALSLSYPEFIEGMIFKFLNASTFDGYNPYRVTKGGFDWETIEPDNPWSYIGYWGDHQIIYLQKFFEIIDKYHPGALQSLFDKEWFVYAAVPYIIKPYEKLLENPQDTIEFDHHWDTGIRQKREYLGADGALLSQPGEGIYHVNLMEKILATVLAKMSNFIPEAGIWMNTQRPEWNDANNALVGNGVSMVTLYYLRRFMRFWQDMLGGFKADNVQISKELSKFYGEVLECLHSSAPLLATGISDKDRKAVLDRLGMAASDYRQGIYQNGFSGDKSSVTLEGLKDFARVSLEFIEHSIRANQRPDKLYHAYNLMTAGSNTVSVAHLSEMLEGQVAVLSSGYLSAEAAMKVLDALKNSALFREDQYSYILYPNKNLPGFLHKNTIPASDAQHSDLLQKLVADGNAALVEQDVEGALHFNGYFKNAKDVELALSALEAGSYKDLVAKDRQRVLDIFEKVFHHKAFTGRSGTFFSYEGLGSIYWHMVSKLLLAVQECCLHAIESKAEPKVIGRLLDHYYEIEAGIGVHKSPALYGAFPTDPYSHTPLHRGAQQPGMTGQVKEDILTHFGELGVFVGKGQLCFNPVLLRKEEFLAEPQVFEYIAASGERKTLALQAGQLGLTYCQVPIVYSHSDSDHIAVHYADGSTVGIAGHVLEHRISSLVFQRTAEVERLEVFLKS